MLSLPTSLFILLSVLATAFLSGILGMAGGMILMGILVWMLPVAAAIVLHAIVQFFANGSRALIHRHHLHWRSLFFYSLGLLAVFGVFWFLRYMPDKLTVFLILGLSPFLAYALPKNLKLDITRPAQAFCCGVAVSGLQLAGGVAGPFLDIFFQNADMTRYQTVATKAATQVASHSAKFVYFSFVISAIPSVSDTLPLWLMLAAVPLAIAGTGASKLVLDRLTDKQFYKATQIVLFIIGVIYLYKALRLMIGGA